MEDGPNDYDEMYEHELDPYQEQELFEHGRDEQLDLGLAFESGLEAIVEQEEMFPEHFDQPEEPLEPGLSQEALDNEPDLNWEERIIRDLARIDLEEHYSLDGSLQEVTEAIDKIHEQARLENEEKIKVIEQPEEKPLPDDQPYTINDKKGKDYYGRRDR